MCKECTNGFRIATRDSGLMAIEKCDTCNWFASDEAAVNAAQAQLPPYIYAEPEYPCYLWVKLNGRAYHLTQNSD